MSDGKFSLENYIDVAERIAIFHEKYPEGSLQTLAWEVQTVGERLFVVYQAAAFRTPDDTRPGVGTAWEPFPGATPYTRDSELMNAETAAWGRAIVAVGLTSSRKIASKQEVRARQGNGSSSAPSSPVPQPTAKPPEKTQAAASAKQRGMIFGRAAEKQMSSEALANVLLTALGNDPREFDSQEAAHDWLQRAVQRLPGAKVDAVLAGIADAPGQLAISPQE